MSLYVVCIYMYKEIRMVTSGYGASISEDLISNHIHMTDFQNCFVTTPLRLYTYTCEITKQYLVFVLLRSTELLKCLEFPE